MVLLNFEFPRHSLRRVGPRTLLLVDKNAALRAMDIKLICIDRLTISSKDALMGEIIGRSDIGLVWQFLTDIKSLAALVSSRNFTLSTGNFIILSINLFLQIRL